MHPSCVSQRAGRKPKLSAVMPIEPGRTDHVEGLLRVAPGYSEAQMLSPGQQERMLAMRSWLRDW